MNIWGRSSQGEGIAGAKGLRWGQARCVWNKKEAGGPERGNRGVCGEVAEACHVGVLKSMLRI